MTATIQRLHAVAEMTTYELTGYRRNLERALSGEVSEDGPTRAQLQTRLDAVLAEQDERERIRHGHGPLV